MGCNTPVALGMALALKHRRIVLLETDGSLLLTLGALATVGNIAPPNLRIFVFDNQGYERVKHDISATSFKTDLAAIATGCGVEDASTARSVDEFAAAADRTMNGDRLSFVVAKVEPGIADGVPPRPGDGLEDKYRFVRAVERLEGRPILAAYRAKLD
jgi:thiamine pyrophosphate-dependent acetolactate synthase large subunit-like protein